MLTARPPSRLQVSPQSLDVEATFTGRQQEQATFTGRQLERGNCLLENVRKIHYLYNSQVLLLFIFFLFQVFSNATTLTCPHSLGFTLLVGVK